MYLTCYVASLDNLIERACEFMGENSMCYAKHFFGGDMIFLTCQVTSRESMFRRLCEFIDGSRSW